MTKYKAENIFMSFQFAIRGLLLSIKSQKNFRTELIIGIIAMILGCYFHFNTTEFALLILTITIVLMAELFNTVIEFVVDAYFGQKYSMLAKMAKDISAGTVLLVSIASLGIGIVLFLPKVMILF